MIKVLMFGWEFPPHISGGLGTACFGLTQSLSLENVQILFVVPKADDHEPFRNMAVQSASNVSIQARHIETEVPIFRASNFTVTEVKGQKATTQISVSSELLPYVTEDLTFDAADILQWNYQLDSGEKGKGKKTKATEKVRLRYAFSGGYGPRLLHEVERYAIVAREIATENSFDIIHAHDWLTFPAAIEAKNISGKPLIVHVHATEYDRCGENADQRVCTIERKGMEQADRVITVSQLTKDIIVS